MREGTVLPPDFYRRSTLAVARDLLGQRLVREIDGERLCGMIVETEAYVGEDDPACHAARGLTPRNRPMYGPPGVAYVYFIYGMYFCLNAVTGRDGFPAAVLIRALEPLEGIAAMAARRGTDVPRQLCNGPGKLCMALGIDRELNGVNLDGAALRIEAGPPLPDTAVASSTRIGIRVGVEHPWRFFVKGNRHVSRP